MYCWGNLSDYVIQAQMIIPTPAPGMPHTAEWMCCPSCPRLPEAASERNLVGAARAGEGEVGVAARDQGLGPRGVRRRLPIIGIDVSAAARRPTRHVRGAGRAGHLGDSQQRM